MKLAPEDLERIEEAARLWVERLRRERAVLGEAAHDWYVVELGDMTPEEWLALVARVRELEAEIVLLRAAAEWRASGCPGSPQKGCDWMLTVATAYEGTTARIDARDAHGWAYTGPEISMEPGRNAQLRIPASAWESARGTVWVAVVAGFPDDTSQVSQAGSFWVGPSVHQMMQDTAGAPSKNAAPPPGAGDEAAG